MRSAQLVVKALTLVPRLPETSLLGAMNEERLIPDDGVILIRIMRRQAAELAAAFGSATWTPRAIDKVLRTYGNIAGTAPNFTTAGVAVSGVVAGAGIKQKLDEGRVQCLIAVLN